MDHSKEIDLVKKQISDCNVRIKKLENNISYIKKSWHELPSVAIALIALLFSFSTTAISYHRSAQQDWLSSRIELRTLVEKLGDIPQIHAKMLKEFDGDAQTVSFLSGTINNSNLVIANQAAEVIDRIEGSWYGEGTVISDEYMAVITALVSSYQTDRIDRYLNQAIMRANNGASMASAVRTLAGQYMLDNRIDEMRQALNRASNIFSIDRFSNEPDLIKSITNATTHLAWAGAEATLEFCENAKRQLDLANIIISEMPDNLPIAQQLIMTRNDVSRQLARC